MNAPTRWVCDTCNQFINSVDDGWVEWLGRADSPTNRGLRLVHDRASSPLGKRGCQYDGDAEFAKDRSLVADLQLDAFVGPDGLTRMLEFASDERFPLEEIIEMIKRLQTPGYDLARRHFRAAIAAGVFEPNTKPGFYDVEDIQRVLDWQATRPAY